MSVNGHQINRGAEKINVNRCWIGSLSQFRKLGWVQQPAVHFSSAYFHGVYTVFSICVFTLKHVGLDNQEYPA